MHWSLHALAMRVSCRDTFFIKCAVSASSVAILEFSWAARSWLRILRRSFCADGASARASASAHRTWRFAFACSSSNSRASFAAQLPPSVRPLPRSRV